MNIQNIGLNNFKGQNTYNQTKSSKVGLVQPNYMQDTFQKSDLSFEGLGSILNKETREINRAIKEIEKLAKSYGEELTPKELEQAKKCLKAKFTDKNAILMYGTKLTDDEIKQATKCSDYLLDERCSLKFGSKFTDDEIEEAASLVYSGNNERSVFEKIAQRK